MTKKGIGITIERIIYQKVYSNKSSKVSKIEKGTEKKCKTATCNNEIHDSKRDETGSILCLCYLQKMYVLEVCKNIPVRKL